MTADLRYISSVAAEYKRSTGEKTFDPGRPEPSPHWHAEVSTAQRVAAGRHDDVPPVLKPHLPPQQKTSEPRVK